MYQQATYENLWPMPTVMGIIREGQYLTHDEILGFADEYEYDIESFNDSISHVGCESHVLDRDGGYGNRFTMLKVRDQSDGNNYQCVLSLIY